MKFVKTSAGIFIAPKWINPKTNKKQIELIAIVWHIKFQNELNAHKNKAYKLRKKLIGK